MTEPKPWPVGTWYSDKTPADLQRTLNELMKSKTRITLDLGDPETGESWGECYDITGYIGRSMGPKKVPLLLPRSNSTGGGAILVDHILSIHASAKPHRRYYQRPKP